MYKVAVFVGSLRKDSINAKFARTLAKLARGRLDFHLVDLSDLPVYNEDLWENPPAGVLRMKDEIAAADAVLFVTPEYNRSIPPVIKNAIDWGTRPWGQNSWAGKPAAIVGTSPGAVGTAAAQGHLRDIVTVVGTALMVQPEVYLVMKPDLIAEDLTIANDSTRGFLDGWIGAFESWIRRLSAEGLKETRAA
jgi:chromate reductase